MKTKLIFLTAMCLLITSLSACSAKEEPKNLFDSQKQAMDKAKGVEEQLQKAADQREEEIRKQTQ